MLSRNAIEDGGKELFIGNADDRTSLPWLRFMRKGLHALMM